MDIAAIILAQQLIKSRSTKPPEQKPVVTEDAIFEVVEDKPKLLENSEEKTK